MSEVVGNFSGPWRGRIYGPLIKSLVEDLPQNTLQEKSSTKSEERTSSWVMVGYGVLAPVWHQKREEDSLNRIRIRPAVYECEQARGGMIADLLIHLGIGMTPEDTDSPS